MLNVKQRIMNKSLIILVILIIGSIAIGVYWYTRNKHVNASVIPESCNVSKMNNPLIGDVQRVGSSVNGYFSGILKYMSSDSTGTITSLTLTSNDNNQSQTFDVSQQRALHAHMHIAPLRIEPDLKPGQKILIPFTCLPTSKNTFIIDGVSSTE